MKYISIDIETTGLDPDKHQILEFAAVVDDLENPRPLVSLHIFQRLIRWDDYVINDYCLELHQNLLSLIHRNPPITITIDQLGPEFSAWLYLIGVTVGSDGYNVAGANFAGFDGLFLKKVPNFPKWHYRVLDVGNLYFEKSMTKLPGLNDVIPHASAHRALPDAMAVVKAVRKKFLTESDRS